MVDVNDVTAFNCTVGTRVMVVGLQSARAALHNGRVGTVESYDAAKGRAVVRLDEVQNMLPDGKFGELQEESSLPLKAVNVQALSRSFEAAAAAKLLPPPPPAPPPPTEDDAAVAAGPAAAEIAASAASAPEGASSGSTSSVATDAPATAKPKSIFAGMFSKSGTAGVLSAKEPDVVWRGGALPRVFLDLVLGVEPVGRLVIELWPHKTPKSAENFRCLCTGERGVSRHSRRRLCYKGSAFHVVLEGMAMFGGDIHGKTNKDGLKNGKGGESVFGEDYEDRSCVAEDAPKHDRPGLVTIGLPGDKYKVDPDDPTPKDQQREHPSFGSRFSIFIMPEPHFNGKLPVVGVVLEGMDVLRMAAKMTPVDEKKRPKVALTIGDCGELPDHGKMTPPLPLDRLT